MTTKYHPLYSVLLLAISALVSTHTYSQDVQELKLKDYRPVSIYKTPQANIMKAKYPAIDLHTHDYPKTDAEVDNWVSIMNEVGVEKSVILSYNTGAAFDAIVKKYSRYPDRFEVWCGYGLSLSPKTLKKMYYGNARRIMGR